MKRYFVGHWATPSRFAAPPEYANHSAGYSRHMLVDHSIAESSVHMGLAMVDIAPEGYLNPVVHAFEKGFYVMDGTVIAHLNDQTVKLETGDYGLIPQGTTYAFSNQGDDSARLLEMMAPQPKANGAYFQDTYFVPGGKAPTQGELRDLKDPRVAKYLGHFEDSQLPPGGSEIQAVGARGGSIHGIQLKELIDRMLGAQHMSLFMVQFQPGGEGTIHDHMFEESYLLIDGEAIATLDGEEHHVVAGDYVWTGVGCMHGFRNSGDGPVRWIETQAPLPTPTEAFRFKATWDYLQRKIENS